MVKDATKAAADISYNLPSNTAVSDRSMDTGAQNGFHFPCSSQVDQGKEEPTETVSNLKMQTYTVAGCWEIPEAKTSREAKTMRKYVQDERKK